MKIGIFDSGLGGMMIAAAIKQHLPQYDYLFLGDTLHLPYGRRNSETIYAHTERAVDYLFRENCHLIIIACNTATAAALRNLQKNYLPQHYPDRRILGVVVPMLETATQMKSQRIGLIGTDYLVRSKLYEEELLKLNPSLKLIQQATPLLVPLIENSEQKWLKPITEDYLAPLLKENIDSLILGCTHYAALKPVISEIVPPNLTILSQSDIIPYALADYLKRHPEHDDKLSKAGQIRFEVTDLTDDYSGIVKSLLKQDISLYQTKVA